LIIRKYKEENNIKIFDEVDKNHSDYNAKGLDILFAQEEKHFWFIARKKHDLVQMYFEIEHKLSLSQGDAIEVY
jgi:hypothetical protein